MMSIMRCFLVLLLFKLDNLNCRVIFVFEHFRHGARSPGFTVTKTKINHTDEFGIFWEGNGELTPIGLRSQYLIGVRNRMKYSKLLSSIYEPREISVFSTQMGRTIMSAQAQLMGMYPPSTGAKINNEFIHIAVPPSPHNDELYDEIKRLQNNILPGQSQIVPVYAIPEQETHQLLSDVFFCPKLRKMKDKAQKDKIVLNYFNKLNSTYGKEIFSFLKITNNSNYLYDFYRVFYLADVFLSDYDNGRDLSLFEKEGIDLQKFYNLSVEMKNLYLFYGECNEYISTIAISQTMRKILSWMRTRIERDLTYEKDLKYQEPKYVMYSGHDTTLAPFQLFMKKIFGTPLKYPHFSSTIYYELHKNDSLNTRTDNDYFIRYFMDDELILEIDFVNFENQVKKETWDDEKINQYCSNEVINGKIILLFIFTIILGIAIIFFFVKNKNKKRREEYHQMGQEMK